MYFWGWARSPGKEGGIQVLAGLAPSSQTVGTPWPAKPAENNRPQK